MSDMREATNPYAAPGADDDGGRVVAVTEGAGYRDQSGMTKLVLSSLGVQGVSACCNALACLSLVLAPGGAFEATAVSVSAAAVSVSSVGFLLGAIPFGAFLVRANKNARAFERAAWEDPLDGTLAPYSAVSKFTPASMVWWFFVPFLNLVRPYHAVQAVWAASAPQEDNLRSTLRSGVLSSWWGAWIASSLWQRVSNTASKMTSITANNVLVTIGGVASLLACLAAMRMVHTLQQRQAQRALELWR